MAAHRARRAASLPSRTPDDVRRSWRGTRCRDRLAAAVRHRVGGVAAVGRRAAAAHVARILPGWIARPPAGRALSQAWRSGPAVVSRWASARLPPCGFLYAALAAAAAAGNPALGALRMLAFGLGTTPALVAVGIVAMPWPPAGPRLFAKRCCR